MTRRPFIDSVVMAMTTSHVKGEALKKGEHLPFKIPGAAATHDPLQAASEAAQWMKVEETDFVSWKEGQWMILPEPRLLYVQIE